MATKYAPQNGTTLLNVANTHLDGTAPVATLIIGDNTVPSPGPYGTIISSIYINALGNTTDGMVRLFMKMQKRHGHE